MAAAAFLTRLASRYNAISTARPFTTTAVMGFTIASIGDVGCQLLVEGPGQHAYDARRTLDMGTIRAVVLAPLLQVYFPFLSWLVPGKGLHRVLLRVCADQAIGAPLTICLTLAAASVLKGRPEDVLPRITDQAWPAWKNGASYWPFVHTLNFSFVPLPHQPLVAHVMSVPWNAMLSYRSNKALGSEGGAEAAAHATAAQGGKTAAAAAAAAAAAGTAPGPAPAEAAATPAS
jgi:hypothetical protein